jgi:O-antigen ligase
MRRTMPDKRSAAPKLPPDRVLVLARAVLVLAVLLFIPGLLEQFEAAKALVLRVGGVMLLGLLVARLPVTRARGLGAVDATVLAWLAVEVAATVCSVNPRVSLLGDTEQHEGLLTSLGLAGLYFGFRVTQGTPAQVARTLGVWLAAVAVGSLYALLQAVHVDPFLWGRTSGYGAGLTRPFGTLGHPNMLGAAGAAALAVVTTMQIKPSRAWLRPALGALFALATALTFSRGAWLAAPVSLAVAWTLAWRARGSAVAVAKPRWPALAVLLVVAVLLAVGPWSAPLRARLGEVFAPGASSPRVEIWRTALAAWRARPLLGQGPDALAMVFSRYQTPAYWRFEWGGMAVNAHSIPIHTLATWQAGERSRALVPPIAGALVATLVAGLLNPIGLAAAALVATLAGSLAALAAARPAAATATAPPARAVKRTATRSELAAWPLAALLALGMLAWCVVDLRSSAAAKQAQGWVAVANGSQGAPRDRALLEAIAWTRRATERDPWSDPAWRDRAEAAHVGALAAPSLEGSLAEAQQAAERAIALAPLRAENHQSLGNLLLTRAQLGDDRARVAGEQAFARAIALAPANANMLLDLARDELKLKRHDAARDAVRRSLALYPDDSRGLALLGETFAALGEADSARAAFTRALAADWHGDTTRVADVRAKLARLP